jgi:hypothetical protein
MEESLAKAMKEGLISEDIVQAEPWINQEYLRAYLGR